MKVSSNLEKFNIENSQTFSNKTFRGNIGQIINVNKDSFQKNVYVTPPKPAVNTSKLLYNTYNSKQLLNAYLSKSYILKLIESNPKISAMMKEKGIDISVYPENVSEMINSHLTTTAAYALQIANKMNLTPYEKQVLEQACVFHDFGKVLIPREILNKSSKLTDVEKEIIDMHSQLGYELLSQAGMNKRVLELVKNHHNYETHNDDILAQILTVADIYSALREERCYKKPLSDSTTLDILDKKVQNGEINEEVLNALKSVLSSQIAA